MSLRLVPAFALALLAGGCGLVDPDVSNFDLYVQDKEFTIDTENWMLEDVGGFTSTSCADAPGLCATAAEAACTEGQCFGMCGAEGTCELIVVVALTNEVNIDTENPELQQIADQPVVDVEIDAIEYQVIENTLNVATPELTLYVAPATTMNPANPEAREIGVIDPIPAGMLVDRTAVTITEDGQRALESFMGDYQTPFNIIVGSQMTIAAGDTVPEGRMAATVQVRAHAGL